MVIRGRLYIKMRGNGNGNSLIGFLIIFDRLSKVVPIIRCLTMVTVMFMSLPFLLCFSKAFMLS